MTQALILPKEADGGEQWSAAKNSANTTKGQSVRAATA
jgi:hypothetical protein